jgi:hypothetical protein
MFIFSAFYLVNLPLSDSAQEKVKSASFMPQFSGKNTLICMKSAYKNGDSATLPA